MRVVPSDIKVGDDVSYCFNGDCYPDGKVVRITKTGRYLYTEHNKYILFLYKSRVKRIVRGTETDDGDDWETVMKEGYHRVGGPWSLVKGIHDERNPHI